MKILLSVVLLLCCIPLSAQDGGISKAPKQISFEAGYRYVVKSEFTNMASQGSSFLFDYAWQLSGFNGRPAGFITVPISYTILKPNGENDQSVRVISYGWTTRHELRVQHGLVPYIGYALMLSQYSENGIDGRLFGHLTRFSVGLNYYSEGKFLPYAQIDYNMTNYPQWGIKGSLTHNYIDAKIGVRYISRRSKK